MNCYLSRNYKDLNGAGNKAKTDIEQIMTSMGFKNIGLKHTFYHNQVISFFLTLAGVIKAVFCLRKGDVLLLQYPLKKYFAFLCNAAHLKGCKVIILIHDLGSFRRKKLTIPQEIRRLNHADYAIALNPSMQKWMKEHGCTMPTGSLGIWDYLSQSHCPSRIAAPTSYKVVYAGALNRRKNAFLYQWGNYIKHYEVSLYGTEPDANSMAGKEHFDIKGFAQFDRLIASADGHFGLVWDGDSVQTCSGNFGEYLQFNNPHKTSLYIRCGLPVIIWDKAALAPFILRHHIGFCIGSLEELDTKLDSLSPEEYLQMRANVLQMSNDLSEGHYFRQAVSAALEAVGHTPSA